MASPKRVAIIGAGTSGLAAIKQCLDEGLIPVCFEQDNFTGGLWRYTEVTPENPNPHSSVYKSITINTSKEMMCYSDFPIPTSWPTFLPNQLVAHYFDLYAFNFDLLRHIRFQRRVIQCSQLGDKRWRVRTVNAKDTQAEPEDDVFNYLMVCTGHHSKPRWPNPVFKGTEEFKGEMRHSHFYRVPYPDVNKRILVLGVGNSGVDLAVELCQHASQVYLSTRSGTWVAPRQTLFGKTLDHVITRWMTFLPKVLLNYFWMLILAMAVGRLKGPLKPRHFFFSAHITINSELIGKINTGRVIVKPNIRRLGPGKRVEFDDGTIEEGIDIVYFCTGYHIEFSFLDKEIVNGGKEDVDLENNEVWLYKNIFPPRFENIAFIGLVQPLGAIMPISEMQSRYTLSFWLGRLGSAPTIPVMDEWIRRYRQIQQRIYVRSPRHTIQISYHSCMDMLAEDLGCRPTLWRLGKEFGWNPRLIWCVYSGPLTPCQYRLVGPQKWKGAKRAVEEYCGYKWPGNYGDEKSGFWFDKKARE
ncbi:flavin monooxygenase-like protein [Endogone sp. FLAS-F59071]|nr:flavin monooxygenase-like protein [Endogone sp. FLAS-F59071]|eukprot:RUS18863.1 flavin monooxygenase-like protein [Endogone sp. FLAS-F59071]